MTNTHSVRAALEEAHARLCSDGQAWQACERIRGALHDFDALIEQVQTLERELALEKSQAETEEMHTRSLHKRLAESVEQFDDAREHAKKIAVALRESVDTIIWMSGSDDFAPGSEAHDGWVRRRDKLYEAMNLLKPEGSTPAKGQS